MIYVISNVLRAQLHFSMLDSKLWSQWLSLHVKWSFMRAFMRCMALHGIACYQWIKFITIYIPAMEQWRIQRWGQNATPSRPPVNIFWYIRDTLTVMHWSGRGGKNTLNYTKLNCLFLWLVIDLCWNVKQITTLALLEPEISENNTPMCLSHELASSVYVSSPLFDTMNHRHAVKTELFTGRMYPRLGSGRFRSGLVTIFAGFWRVRYNNYCRVNASELLVFYWSFQGTWINMNLQILHSDWVFFYDI